MRLFAAAALASAFLVPASAADWSPGVDVSALAAQARSLVPAAAPAPVPVPVPRLTPFADAETMDYVYGQAVKRSGRPDLPSAERPAVFRVSAADLERIVCAESENSCRMLAAVFDDLGYRVLIREDLDLADASMLSYLIHETVHALQYRQDGPEIFRDCAAVLRTETEAYRVQDAYLKDEGQFLRAGQVLRFFHCDEAVAAKDYAKSKAAWDARTASGRFVLPSR